MKSVLLCALLVFAVAASVSASCPASCPPHRNPVCGFDGMCIYNFNNGCEMIRYNCQRGGFFRNTSPHQCQTADAGRNAYRICHHIQGF